MNAIGRPPKYLTEEHRTARREKQEQTGATSTPRTSSTINSSGTVIGAKL